ncbi:MAG TPA: SIR2 family protein [Candidatus Solibacter sp.]|nr:SIR2 family protein [Candidatus Solibacter sp.]
MSGPTIPSTIQPEICEAARARRLVIMAGAGVSAGNPSALPSWKPLNTALVGVLRKRLESALDGRLWLEQPESLLNAARGADRFPPEYQAQLIEEMCGERYFRALQSLDVDAYNSSHEAIASLASAGVVRAIVTTNFDRLIERALEKYGVAYQVAFDTPGFEKMGERLQDDGSHFLPLIKIHGCVSEPLSMVDTLKQRKLGRSRSLELCLEALYKDFWLYLGFSAADLESNPKYLGLVDGAATSVGAVYVAYPGDPKLGTGAKILMDAYGDHGSISVAFTPEYVGELCQALHLPAPEKIPADESLGLAQFHRQLEQWASQLSLAASGLCFAAILEAIGESEPAVRIMDRLVRKEIYDERETPEYRLLQLHYGRLGCAYGRFFAVPDLNGMASNASVETTQSLLRICDTELGFAAASWLACMYLWMNQGAQAMAVAGSILRGFLDSKWEPRSPRCKEEVVDAWCSAAQAIFLNTHVDPFEAVIATFPASLASARESGDVVRTARVAALYLLPLSETSNDVPALAGKYSADFAEAARVGDGVSLGFRALALGRWHVGVGGLALGKQTGDREKVANQALQHLQAAIGYFNKQGMDPWSYYVLLQAAKALADLNRWDEAQESVNTVKEGLNRFPILASHLYETAGQLQAMFRNPEAEQSFRDAIQSAQESGLGARAETLTKNLEHYLQSLSAVPQS